VSRGVIPASRTIGEQAVVENKSQQFSVSLVPVWKASIQTAQELFCFGDFVPMTTTETETAGNKPKTAESLKEIEAETLFQNRREVIILLDGVRYILRITRNNRLILQK
jgi:hemin uptake protein HemP